MSWLAVGEFHFVISARMVATRVLHVATLVCNVPRSGSAKLQQRYGRLNLADHKVAHGVFGGTNDLCWVD
jgi:hypothetical protein